jgi:Family of unknown function (DUF5519)
MADSEQDLDGYVIEPIPLDQYAPMHDQDLTRFARIFPRRPGPKPRTTDHEPHQQIDQHADPAVWDELHRRCFSLSGVTEEDSKISVPGARALVLDETLAKGVEEAFIVEREFAHIHPRPDGSTHLKLPLELAVLAIGAGWAEPHNVVWLGFAPANTVMLYAPRTPAELDTIVSLVEESYRFACGEPQRFVIKPQLVSSADD